jgi:hypothetical protein
MVGRAVADGVAREPEMKAGTAVIEGRERHAFAYARDRVTASLSFIAIPGRFSFDPNKEGRPPEVEKFVIPEGDFKPIDLG